MATPRICSIPDCGKPVNSRGWCSGHYARWWRRGDIGGELNPKAASGEALRYFREVVLDYDGPECLIWPFSRNSSGYGQLKFDGRPQAVSHLVCEEARGPAPTPEHEAAHSCGNGHLACVTKRHLSWKTRTGNVADTLIHGTRSRGERNGQAILTTSDILEIRTLRGVQTQAAVAVQFGTSRSNVGLIQSGKSWAWVE